MNLGQNYGRSLPVRNGSRAAGVRRRIRRTAGKRRRPRRRPSQADHVGADGNAVPVWAIGETDKS